MYYSVPNPFIITGQLREMWSKYIAWLYKHSDDSEKENDGIYKHSDDSEKENDGKDYFLEKDQYDAAGDDDEVSAYVAKHAEIKPFMDVYFQTWQLKFGDRQTHHDLDNEIFDLVPTDVRYSPRVSRRQSPKQSPKQNQRETTRSKLLKDADDDDEVNLNYVAMKND